MKLTELSFRGYKGFASEPAPRQELALAPLTLVFGKNNSGKSSVARLPILILGAMEGREAALPTTVREEKFGENFLDLVYGGDFFGKVEIGFKAENADSKLGLLTTLFSRSVLFPEEAPSVWAYEISGAAASLARDPAGSAKLDLQGILPRNPALDVWRTAASSVLDQMIHLGPIRKPIQEAYSNSIFSGFGRDGSGVPALLRQEPKLVDACSSWFQANMDGWSLGLTKDTESFTIRASRRQQSTNLSQAGEGLQQVLPVVAHQFLRRIDDSKDYLDIVEQPELHLHAAAQAPLADLFIETVKLGSGTTVVETNSEGMLLRVQRRVAEGSMDPALLAIYFIESAEQGSNLRRINIDRNGELDWWPTGVFEESFSEIAAIRRAQRANFQEKK